MFLLFLQIFWWYTFSINIPLDTQLNFMLRLLNKASQVIIHFQC